MTDTKRQRGAGGKFVKTEPATPANDTGTPTPAAVEASRQSPVPAGVVEFTREDPLTGWSYTGRGVVVADLGTGVFVVAPLADHTVQVDASAVRALGA